MAQNHILLETIQLSQSASSVTFDNIPQTGYTDLKIVVSARSANTDEVLLYRLNGTTSGYTGKVLIGNGSSAYSGNLTTLTAGAGGTWGRAADTGINSSATTANTFSNYEMYIPNYTSSNNKSISVDSVYENNATTGYIEAVSLLWSNTAAITSVGFAVYNAGSFAAGSTFSIYGIAALGTTPAIAPFASGGNIVANDGTYWYHAFLSSGNFVPSKALTCDYLVVAGGGSGGVGSGGGGGAGGGGAGGFRTSMATTGGGGSAESPVLVTAQSYAITVGAGAAAVSLPDRIDGLQGNNSIFASITSTGGGFGSGASNSGVHPGGSGGSGGGASEWNRTTGTTLGGSPATPTQGFRGGNCAPTSPDRHGAGGGGAAQAGGDTVNAANGKGGDGYSVTFVSNALINIPSAMAGGGGGSSEGNPSAGGLGGGGAGPSSITAIQVGNSGTANTGSGGSGLGGNSGLLKTSGAGGSGIVVIRYPMV